MTMRGPVYKQLNDPTASYICSIRNCVPSCFSMAATRDSVGKYNLTATQIRNKAGASCSDVGTATGGVGYLAGATAVRSLTNGEVRLEVANVTPTELYHYLLAGRAAIVSVDYGRFVGTKYACNATGNFGHGIFVNQARTYRGVNQYLKGDPLCDGRGSYPDGWQWTTASLIHRAGLDRSGGNGINVVLTQDTERVRRYSLFARPVYAKPRTDAAILGKTKEHTAYFVQATVTYAGKHFHRIPFGGRTGYVLGRDLM